MIQSKEASQNFLEKGENITGAVSAFWSGGWQIASRKFFSTPCEFSEMIVDFKKNNFQLSFKNKTKNL